MSKNICRFIPNSGSESNLNILNFVHETKRQLKEKIKYETTYKMHLVTKGSGEIFLFGKEYFLECGDVFFTFPSMEYAVRSNEDFEYMYISFIGMRTNNLLDRLNINKENFLFKNQKKLMPVWQESILDNKSILNLRCEGILLYSFSVLGEQTAESKLGDDELTVKVKSYIDEHFTDSDISLEIISKLFAYNKKYISTVFKQKFRVGIAQYISTLRIQYACTLVESGFSSVSDIAHMCGFSDAQYFSRVFKGKMGVSPKEHIKTQS